VPNDPVDRGSRGSSACYPWRTFYPLSGGASTGRHRITMAEFPPWSIRRSSQSSRLLPLNLNRGKPQQTHHCTPPLPFRRQPPQLNCPPNKFPAGESAGPDPDWHCRRPTESAKTERFQAYQLSYAGRIRRKCRATVKVHRVFPSRRSVFASSRRFQIHWGGVGDSGEVVKPFMQVGTYPTRNFATLEPSEIQLPFTGA
jgi:hypothetical protein